MKISIALATYNGEEFLAEQLSSYLVQTRLPDELVVVDDGSNDGTSDIIQTFAEEAPFPVRFVVNTNNLGYAQNFGKALSLCSGDLIFLSDQDDVWFDTKIETVVTFASNNTNTLCILNDTLLTNGELVSSEVTKMERIRAAGLPETMFVMGCCAAVKRDLLEIVLPIPQEMPAHDNWLVGLADYLGLTHRIPVVLQYYRRHGANVSNFILNGIYRQGKLQKLIEGQRQIRRKIRSGDSLDKEYRFYEALAERIADERDICIRLVGLEKTDATESSIITCLETLSVRRNIRSMGFTKRLRIIIGLWSSGGYRRSGGIFGAMKDLVLHVS